MTCVCAMMTFVCAAKIKEKSSSNMAERSLQASLEGIKAAQIALIEKFSTQQRLADALEITRQPVSKFFNSKPIDSGLFVRICEKLGLDWKVVAVNLEPNNKSNLQHTDEIEDLLSEVRKKIKPKIQEQCGLMRVLDMTHPIGLCDIYTDVNILETITGRQWIGIEELLDRNSFDPNSDNFDRRGLAKVAEKRVSGPGVVNRYPKLMVLGKPGAGKSTFLKYLAIQCIWEKFQSNRIPVFITLKEFAEAKNQPDLFDFICQTFSIYDVKPSQIKCLLDHGRLLLLLDGLDEVREEDNDHIIRQIQHFSEQFFFSQEFKVDQSTFLDERDSKIKGIEEIRDKKFEEAKRLLEGEGKNPDKKSKDMNKYKELYDKAKNEFETQEREISRKYPDILREVDQGLKFLSDNFPGKVYNNHFIITCRIAAREYVFQHFVEVEVADFDDLQIRAFVKNWFGLKDAIKGTKFLDKLLENQPLKELASSPLLLTLLCLVFEESADFPVNRSELYKEGVSVLLKKWDAQRNIERDQVYKDLSTPRKEDLLSSVAFHTFDLKDYFFKRRDAENYIAEYIRNLPNSKTDLHSLQLDSEVVLKSIEAQHGLLVERARGIYSFSHLTFQEYFTARKIVITSEPQEMERALSDLATHIIEKRWREVLLLALGMLPNAERLLKLLKQYVDNILVKDPELQKFLIWVQEKSLSYTSYKPEAIRCIYFSIGCDLTHDLPKVRSKIFSSEPDLDRTLEFVQLLDKQLVDDITSEISTTNAIVRDFIVARDLARNLAIDLARNLTTIPGFNDKSILKPVTQKLPDFTRDKSFIAAWWNSNGDRWTEGFRSLVIKHYNIGRNWQFNLQQRSTLKQYYNASKMLFEFLSSDCYVKREVRQEIRDSLFLPTTEEALHQFRANADTDLLT